MTKALLAIVLLCSAPISQADILIRPAASYAIDKTENGTGSSTVTRRLLDIGAGYLSPDGWMILGMWATENRKSDPSGTLVERTGLGAGGGYMSKAGPYIDFIYYLQAEQAGSGTHYTGDGGQLDLGWNLSTGKVGVGLQMTYRYFDFTKANGATVSPAYKQSNLDPMFALILAF